MRGRLHRLFGEYLTVGTSGRALQHPARRPHGQV